MEPDSQGAAKVERIQVAPGAQEGFLGQVLCQFGTSGEPEQVAVDARVVAPEEDVAGLGVALAQALDEGRILEPVLVHRWHRMG